jgi:hypothetical protein
VAVADRDGAASIDTTADAAPRPRRSTSRLWNIAAWVGVPAASAIWVAANSTRYYPVYDEWVTIDRALNESVWRDLLLGFNGHMWSVTSLGYILQARLFDFQGNWFLPTLLVISLVTLQLGLAGVFFRLGLPTPVALAAATVITYFGPASETMVYQHLYGYNLALALSFVATFVALGRRRTATDSVGDPTTRRAAFARRRDRRTAVLVAVLLLVALASDSALALPGLIVAGAVVVFLWPFRLALVALVPPLVGHVAWFALDQSQVLAHGVCLNCAPFTFSVGIRGSVEFAVAILTRSAGGLVGGSVTAGVVVLVLASACTVFGLVTHRLSRPVIACLVGGITAALVSVGLFAYSRAGFWPTIDDAIDSLDSVSNRYVQPAAIFLMIAFGPAIYATLKPSGRTASKVFTGVATAALAVVFIVNLGSVWPTRDFYRDWSASTKSQLREAVTVVSEGCGAGERLNPDAQPSSASFQITARLVEDLLDRGLVDADFGTPASPAVRAKICVPG